MKIKITNPDPNKINPYPKGSIVEARPFRRITYLVKYKEGEIGYSKDEIEVLDYFQGE